VIYYVRSGVGIAFDRASVRTQYRIGRRFSNKPIQEVTVTRQEATALILQAKRAKELTFQQIAEEVGRHKVWTTAALLGQASMSKDEAEKAVACLGLGPEVSATLQECPTKGSLDATVPVDPLIYRLHEITQVYGTTVKALIHEMFGDGIMSAIDFELDLERIPDPHGDRVRITYNGKFLPYRKW
jgi:cyanate lyase